MKYAGLRIAQPGIFACGEGYSIIVYTFVFQFGGILANYLLIILKIYVIMI